MDTATQEQEQQVAPVVNAIAEQTEEDTLTENDVKKKYHSSAMYAASKWHGTVNHVKPTHGRLDF